MDRFFTVAQVVAPIFAAIFLGMMAKRKNWLSSENVQGFQTFVMKIGLPCVVFNSCLTAQMGMESISSMAMVLPCMLLSTLGSFWARKKWFPYHNFPQLFCAQETGMLGIPLFMILFGADQAYRMGILDLTQSITAIPVIAILSADAGENPKTADIAKKVVSSPLLLMSLLGLTLNLTGVATWMDNVGIGPVITETTTFLSTPISALMIFAVGYNFSLEKGSRSTIVKVSVLHIVVFAIFCLLIQAALFLIPNVDALTRWAILLYCTLPGSYLATGLGRSKDDYVMASGVCSILTVVSLAIFCVITAMVA